MARLKRYKRVGSTIKSNYGNSRNRVTTGQSIEQLLGMDNQSKELLDTEFTFGTNNSIDWSLSKNRK